MVIQRGVVYGVRESQLATERLKLKPLPAQAAEVLADDREVLLATYF